MRATLIAVTLAAASSVALSAPVPPATHGVIAASTARSPASPGPPGDLADRRCTCEKAVTTNGWCDLHETGYVGGVRVRSKMLYETLDAHGHTLDLSTFTCPECRKAIETDGFCTQHRNGFIAKQTYFSRLTYELGRGRVADPKTIACPVCRRNARRRGWCAKHHVGMAGPFAIADREAWQRAVQALEILEIANAAAERCEGCALAIVTDTFCPTHRIRYRDGRAAGPSSPPSR